MNYFTKKSIEKIKRINWSNYEVLTNIKLLKAIFCVELVHRNVLWRLFEYLYWLIFPRNCSSKRILTIGKFQIKTMYLTNKSKIKCIIYSNKIESIDNLLYNHFPTADWKLISEDLLLKIVSFYNGDKTGEYIRTIKILIDSQ